MQVARLYAAGDIRVSQEPAPTPGPGDVLIKVTAVGLCGSDLHWFEDGGIGDASIDRPLVPGHEFAGVIAQGPDAGQRVAVDPAIACLACDLCLAGHPNLCVNIEFAGHSRDGALREYLAWPSRCVHPVPDSFSDADAAMLEPLGVAIHMMDLSHMQLADTVLVVGCGPIGLLAMQLARVAGAASLVAVEPLAHRREAASSWADVILDPGQADFDQALSQALGPLGAQRVLECAGTDSAIDISVAGARPGATVVLAGIPSTTFSHFDAAVARRKGLTFRMVRRMKDVYPRAIALVSSGQVDVTSLVTDSFALADAQLACEVACRRSGLKVVINTQDIGRQ